MQARPVPPEQVVIESAIIARIAIAAGQRAASNIRVDWGAIKLPESCVLRDLCQKKDMGPIAGGYTFRLARHVSARCRARAVG